MKKQEKAEEFVKKVAEEKKQRENKLETIRKKELEKLELSEQERKEKAEKRAEKLKKEKERRAQEYQEQKEKERLAKEKRDEEWKKFQQAQKTNNQYLHEKLEQEFNEKVLMPELEKKKQVLKEKRDFYKPIDHKEIDDFQKKYEENIKYKLEEKRMKREQWYDDIGVGKYDPTKFKTKVLEKVMEESKGTEEIKQKEMDDKKHKAEKMKNYAKIVKQMHWPDVSPKKQQEIERIKELLENKNKRRSAPPKNRNNVSKDHIYDPEHAKNVKRPVWNFNNPLVPKPKPKKEPVVVDYLLELRVKREAVEKDGTGSRRETGANWKNLINSDDKLSQDKIELLKARTKLIEENAERKEKMGKISGASVEDNVDINDMLIDAIEMKLSILDQIE